MEHLVIQGVVRLRPGLPIDPSLVGKLAPYSYIIEDRPTVNHLIPLSSADNTHLYITGFMSCLNGL